MNTVPRRAQAYIQSIKDINTRVIEKMKRSKQRPSEKAMQIANLTENNHVLDYVLRLIEEDEKR